MDDDNFKDYMEAYKEKMSEFINKPEMFEQILDPLMKMQQKYFDSDGNSKLALTNNDNNDASALQKISQRVQTMRKKILPDIMQEMLYMKNSLSRIEKHLGIESYEEDEIGEEEDNI